MRVSNFAKVLWRLIPLAVLWYVWKWRNDVLFNGKSPRWDSASDFIITRIALWAISKSKMRSVSVNDIMYNLQSVIGRS